MLKEILIKEGLSNRESEVAELVTQGLSNREVAEKLFVTEKTVKFHLTNIYKKMNVKSRAQLIVWCLPNMTFIDRRAPQQSNQSTPQQPTTLPTGSNVDANAEKKDSTELDNLLPGVSNNYNY